MGRKRKSNRHLPPRVYIHGKAFRFVPIRGPKVTLGPIDDFAGMMRRYADLISGGDGPRFDRLADVMDRYLADITPGKCAEARRKEPGQIARLRRAFGQFRPGELEKSDVYEYLDARGQISPFGAVREVELLRHICTVANTKRRWGKWPVNPLLGLSLEQPKPRRRYVSNDEYTAVWQLAPPMVRAAMDLTMLTGLRRGDILGLTRSNITDAGLQVTPSKTRDSSGVELIFQYTTALREVLRDALAQPPHVRQFIVCNTQGRQYSPRAFEGVWRRVMRKHIAAGGESFQFRDLRKKSASDEIDAAVASARLGHSSQGITNRVYRIKPRTLRPLK